MFLALLFAFFMLSAAPARAQMDGEILTDPICFYLINKAPYTVLGSVNSNIYQAQDNVKARHRSNFRLEVGQKAPFCSTGPFYEGRKLELTLRTVIPIFSCKTAITRDIVIEGERKDGGSAKTWATCY